MRLVERFQRVRSATERLAEPLSAEDRQLQASPDSSPTKWHLAHTTWFFETFLLQRRGIAPVRPEWSSLFNSYYVSVGPRAARPSRGLMSRPSTDEIRVYRLQVDEKVIALLDRADEATLADVHSIVELGLAHEEQHQELLLTDILAAFHQNPLLPVYRANGVSHPAVAVGPPLAFHSFGGGLVNIGAKPTLGFRFDNEEPEHRVFLNPFSMANRLVTVGEWKAFADAGGYDAPALWLSEGFDWARSNAVTAPLYCHREGGSLVAFGLGGVRELGDDEPLSHVSYYEADAIARFLGARLPTEMEWEHAVVSLRADPATGNFVEDGDLAPRPSASRHQLFGDVWEWTSSSYAPYPGFQAAAGAVGEYNGKFMVNQQVLRGGSCFTPRGHVRASYRNFWHPPTRFQMSGLRLARTEPQ